MLRQLSSIIDLKIQIQYGTTNTANRYRSALFLFLAIVALVVNYIFMTCLPIGTLLVCEKSSQKLNASVSDGMQCPPLYRQCWCSLQTQGAENSNGCSFETCRRYLHPLVLIWFVLQVCILRELFTCVGCWSRVFVYFLYTLAFLIFISMYILIYWSNCFHRYTATILHMTCGFLGAVAIHDLLNPRARVISSQYDTSRVNRHRIRRNERQAQAWHELL